LNRELADHAFAKAAQLPEITTNLLVNIGQAYEFLRQPAKAVSFYQQAVAGNSTAISPRMLLAQQYERAHRLNEARLVVAESLTIDPTNEGALYLSAVLDRREGDLDGAERTLRNLRVKELNNLYVRYSCRYELAHIYDQIGREDDAMTMLIEAKTIQESFNNTKTVRGRIKTSHQGSNQNQPV